MGKILHNIKIERFPVYADANLTGSVVDVHKEVKTKSMNIKRLVVTSNLTQINDFGSNKLDITTWLPYASKEYNISPDIKDYFFVPVITIPSDLPNRNCVSFPLSQLLKFQVESGRQAYKSFKGKPVHYEHDNQDPLKAYGVIADSFLKQMKGFGQGKVWKLIELLAIDRSKNPDIARRILDRDLNSYSMGAMVGHYTCSYCNAKLGECSHLSPKSRNEFYELNGHLVHRQCNDIDGFETSIVETPAFHVANSNVIYS